MSIKPTPDACQILIEKNMVNRANVVPELRSIVGLG